MVTSSNREEYCDYKRVDADGNEHQMRIGLQYWGRNETSVVMFALFWDLS